MWDVLAAFPAEALIGFTIGGLILNFAPGADVFFATACGIQGGPRAGIMAGLGVGIGVVWHVTLAALGLSAVIAAHPEALSAIRWAGATYLLWLAWKSWRAGAGGGSARGVVSPLRAVARGFLSNAMNPKPVLFILAFLPQFTNPAYGPIWQQIVILGGIFAFTGTLVTMGYGWLAGVLGRSLSSRMGVVNKIAAVMFGGLAAKLAIS
ncbi:amino acid transporter [Rhodobacter veldkampii DSM 11550]|uniref:LysE family translocator n=1 Tax=Phaeovulum veldkampii DSM 11550 TaxID=1185920 RepID=A0A2T4JIG9_9RHOB|nr:LysE family translocator [Phaeovulum veldkampii]MBK5946979.1 amino acid transporter [Phaeovulum veldkampii DSM 11550]PTE17662.1 LysE family translocator [Phaeovulum veldkampii DSM 11550]TDQ57506.1 threonine/homoserine/homoserine lactone efflux protein [Phaeovulum veldkampii DSM 11550]